MSLSVYLPLSLQTKKKTVQKEKQEIKVRRRSVKYKFEYPVFTKTENNFYECNICKEKGIKKAADYFTNEKGLLRHITQKHFLPAPELMPIYPQTRIDEFF